VRRDDGRTYREMLTQMAKESGIETPHTNAKALPNEAASVSRLGME
jgi:hypothetical protein